MKVKQLIKKLLDCDQDAEVGLSIFDKKFVSKEGKVYEKITVKDDKSWFVWIRNSRRQK